MEDWVRRALARWPDVPALYGWLSLDRRGRWRIRGGIITRPQIVETIARNYAPDAQGRWYFQNGPQRGYVRLEYAPLILRAEGEGEALLTHTGLAVTRPSAAYLDEEGSIVLHTEYGPGLLADADLGWALRCLRGADAAAGAPSSGFPSFDEDQLAGAMALPCGAATSMILQLGAIGLNLRRLDVAQMPSVLGFERDPRPRVDEPGFAASAPAA